MGKTLFMNKTILPITLLSIVNTKDYICPTVLSMMQTLESITPEYGSYIICPRSNYVFPESIKPIEVNMQNIDYSYWMLSHLGECLSSHSVEYKNVLIQQWDSCVINPSLWNDDFLNYDYIGAP